MNILYDPKTVSNVFRMDDGTRASTKGQRLAEAGDTWRGADGTERESGGYVHSPNPAKFKGYPHADIDEQGRREINGVRDKWYISDENPKGEKALPGDSGKNGRRKEWVRDIKPLS